jgi:soluble lytic murein transglycosylase-like protein
MRKLSELALLRTRKRRGLIVRLAIGLALLVPALLLMSTAGFEGVRPTQLVGAAERSTTDPMAAQWRERILEAERTQLITDLASEFEVPVSLAQQIHEAALDAELDLGMAFGLVAAESSFRTAAVSPVGAIGLTQVMPATARDVEPGTTRSDLLHPETNLRIGFSYLRKLIDQYDGNAKLALTAYNRGPGTVDRVLKRGGNPDNGYAEKVLTGQSERHVRLMNAKFGGRRTRS